MPNNRFNLRIGDILKISHTNYKLEKRLGGGYQFRTWIVSNRGKNYVAKLSDDNTSVTHEADIYLILKDNGVPNRYYPELVISITDRSIHVFRNDDEEIGFLSGMIIKYYPYMVLSEYLASNPPESERGKVADKLLRRADVLHRLGIVHQDLHKKNILVRRTQKGYIGCCCSRSLTTSDSVSMSTFIA